VLRVAFWYRELRCERIIGVSFASPESDLVLTKDSCDLDFRLAALRGTSRLCLVEVPGRKYSLTLVAALLMDGRRDRGRGSSVPTLGCRVLEALREALRTKLLTSRVTSRVMLRALLTAREFMGTPVPRVLVLPPLLSERRGYENGGSSSLVVCPSMLRESSVAESTVGEVGMDAESGLATASAVGTGFLSGTVATSTGICGVGAMFSFSSS
jgi:hypothetical protein